MSITGISNYGLQNITNENVGQDQYEDLTTRVTQNESDIVALEATVGGLEGQVAANTSDLTTLEGQVATNTSDLTTLEGQVATNTSDITGVQAVNTTQNASIDSILQRIKDVQYYEPNDTTFIYNRLEIRSPIDSINGAIPMLTLRNTSTQDPNKIQCQFMVGVENNNWNNIVEEGDCLFLTRNFTGVPGSYLGGMVFCTHGGPAAFRFSYDADIPSRFQSNIDLVGYQLTTTGDVSCGTLTLSGVNLSTTLTGLRADIDAIDHHLLSADLECAGFDINGCGTLNADTVMAGGWNVKNRITTLQNDVADLQGVDHYFATQNYDMNGWSFLNTRQIQLTTGSKTALLGVEATDDMQIQPPLGGDFVVRTSISGASKTWTVKHDSVDFNGRLITNATFFLPEERAQQEASMVEEWVIQPFSLTNNQSVQGSNCNWKLTGSSSGLLVSNTTLADAENSAEHPGVVHFRLQYTAGVGYFANGVLTWGTTQGVYVNCFQSSRTIFKLGTRPYAGLGVNVYPDFSLKIGLSNDTGFASSVYWECVENNAWRLYVNGTLVYSSTLFVHFNPGVWLCCYFIKISGGIRGVIEMADHSVVDSFDYVGTLPTKFKPMIGFYGTGFYSGTPDRNLFLDYTDFQYKATRV